MMATLLNRSFRVIPGWSLARFHYRPVPVVYSRLEKPMTTPQMTSIMSDKVIIAMEPLSRKLSTSLVDGLQVKDESTASSSRSNDAPILQAKVIEKPTLKAYIRDYGFFGVFVYGCTSIIVFLTFLPIVRFFVSPAQVADFVANFDMLSGWAGVISSSSTFGVAYLLLKATFPLRLGFVFWATPRFVKFLKMKKILKS